LEDKREFKVRQYQDEIFQDAWERLDSTIGPTGRIKMREANKKAEENKAP
jgi:hypothetical protein